MRWAWEEMVLCGTAILPCWSSGLWVVWNSKSRMVFDCRPTHRRHHRGCDGSPRSLGLTWPIMVLWRSDHAMFLPAFGPVNIATGLITCRIWKISPLAVNSGTCTALVIRWGNQGTGWTGNKLPFRRNFESQMLNMVRTERNSYCCDLRTRWWCFGLGLWE